jgi:hypothetical protein
MTVNVKYFINRSPKVFYQSFPKSTLKNEIGKKKVEIFSRSSCGGMIDKIKLNYAPSAMGILAASFV